MCAKHSIAETWHELNYEAHWVAALEKFCNFYSHLSLKTVFPELKLRNYYINLNFFS